MFFESVGSDRSRDVIKRNSHCDRTLCSGIYIARITGDLKSEYASLERFTSGWCLGFCLEWVTVTWWVSTMSFRIFFYGKYQLSWKEEIELVAGFSCARSETDWSWEPTPFRMRTDNSSKRLQESSIEIHTMTTVTVHKSITKVLESWPQASCFSEVLLSADP